MTVHNSSMRSDQGLTLETSAFQIFHDDNSTLINSFDKTNFFSLSHGRSSTVSLETRNQFFFHSPTDAAPQFL